MPLNRYMSTIVQLVLYEHSSIQNALDRAITAILKASDPTEQQLASVAPLLSLRQETARSLTRILAPVSSGWPDSNSNSNRQNFPAAGGRPEDSTKTDAKTLWVAAAVAMQTVAGMFAISCGVWGHRDYYICEQPKYYRDKENFYYFFMPDLFLLQVLLLHFLICKYQFNYLANFALILFAISLRAKFYDNSINYFPFI